MDFSLSDDQLALREDVVTFAETELREGAGASLLARERDGAFDRNLWQRCADFGVLGSLIPERYGGLGRDAVTTVLMLEAIGYGSLDNGLSLGLGGQIWSIQEPILVYGSEEQRQSYLPRLISGELIGAHGVSEEGSGSDALSLQTRAEKVDGGYVLNGRKTTIGMAPVCDLAVVLARTDPDAGQWGVSAFIVEATSDGFTRSAPRAKTGTRTNPLGDLILDDCFVPESARLGGEGIGMSLFTKTISWERAFIHAGHLGSMERLIERCVDYTREREQFGRPIGDFQSVSNRLANMRLRLETSKLLMYKAATLKDQGVEAPLECAMAKLHIAESLLESATDAVRIHGARGYLAEFEVERDLRDSIGAVIYAGTSDIQRNLIAELMLRYLRVATSRYESPLVALPFLLHHSVDEAAERLRKSTMPFATVARSARAMKSWSRQLEVSWRIVLHRSGRSAVAIRVGTLHAQEPRAPGGALRHPRRPVLPTCRSIRLLRQERVRFLVEDCEHARAHREPMIASEAGARATQLADVR